MTSTNVPLSPATFWPFAAANRQNAIATRARPRPGRGRAKPREGSEPRRADEGERADIDRLCRRDIHITHLTGQRRASSVCPFFSSSPLLVRSSASPFCVRAMQVEGSRVRATAERHSLLFPLFYIAFRMSTSHEKRREAFFETSTLRGIFPFPLIVNCMRSDGTCPARLHERHTRSPFHGSSSSSLGVDRVSLELLCSAPRRSRLRPKSTDCPFPRLLGSLASPPPGPPVRAPSPFPTRERSARALRASRVRPHGVFQAVERPHAARARLSSVAFGRINIPRWQSPKKQHFPRSRRLTPPPPRLPTPTQASACAPWPPKRSPASGFAASP